MSKPLSRITRLIGVVCNIRISRLLLSFKYYGYLVELGWFYTLKNKDSVDKEKKPIPWATYSYIEFIKSFLKPYMCVFEYGSGNSTLFYAFRAHSVTAIEHDKNWYEKISKEIPENVTVIYQPLDEFMNYERTIEKNPAGYDVIIIDGRNRVKCIETSVGKLNDNGILVVDDSEREDYATGFKFLKEAGFKRIDFWGIAPMYFHNKCTSIFYRKELFP